MVSSDSGLCGFRYRAESNSWLLLSSINNNSELHRALSEFSFRPSKCLFTKTASISPLTRQKLPRSCYRCGIWEIYTSDKPRTVSQVRDRVDPKTQAPLPIRHCVSPYRTAGRSAHHVVCSRGRYLFLESKNKSVDQRDVMRICRMGSWIGSWNRK